MEILSKHESALQVTNELPRELYKYNIDNCETYYAKPKNGNHYIIQKNVTSNVQLFFIDLIALKADDCFIKNILPGAELIMSLQNSIHLKIDKLDNITFHERGMNMIYTPNLYKDIKVEALHHYSFVVIKPTQNWLEEIIAEDISKTIFLQAMNNNRPALLNKINAIADRTILDLIQKLKSIKEVEKMYGRLLELFTTATIKIINNPNKKIIPLDHSEVEKIYTLVDFGKNNLDKRFHFESLRQKYKISKEVFRHYFLHIYGLTLSHLLLEFRMIYSIELLKKNEKIETIARKTGYEHPSTFIAAFKNYYGQTPEEYKLRNNL
jgi:AraC-like DNA-binding protein